MEFMNWMVAGVQMLIAIWTNHQIKCICFWGFVFESGAMSEDTVVSPQSQKSYFLWCCRSSRTPWWFPNSQMPQKHSYTVFSENFSLSLFVCAHQPRYTEVDISELAALMGAGRGSSLWWSVETTPWPSPSGGDEPHIWLWTEVTLQL